VNTVSQTPAPRCPPARGAHRFPELDGFRGLLALAVPLVHCRIMPIYWTSAGTDCFFTLSAFVITLGLLNSDARSRAELLQRFFLRRAARIFPLYYALLAAVVLLLATGTLPDALSLHGYSFSDLRPYWFFGQYTGLYAIRDETKIWDGQLGLLDHSWSLAVMAQFYLLWGLLFASSPNRLMRMAAALVFIQIGVIARISGDVMSPLLVYRLDAFGYGILLALLYHDAVRAFDPARLRRIVLLCALFFVAAIAICFRETDVIGHLRRWTAGQEQALVWQWQPISALSSAASAALVGLIAYSSGSRWLQPLRTPVMRYFGSISYAVYLIHYPVVGLLLNPESPLGQLGFPVRLALTVALVLGLAHLVTRFANWANERLIASIGHSRVQPVLLPSA
jgi:peptidoglycan/LPS O-acetylase OafA/YrhL